MALTDYKFNESDFTGRKITDLSDTPSSDGMTAEALKTYFDYIPKTMIALGAVNRIIDLLVSSTGAENIGASVSGVTGTQIQAILESIKTMLDDRYTKSAVDDIFDTKADNTTVNTMVKSISFNKDTGVFTITEQGGSTYTIDTLLEKLAVNFKYDKPTQSLIITNSDGSTQTVSLSDFITDTEIKATDTISVTDTDGVITLNIKSGSITDDMLSSTLLTLMQGYVQSCASSGESAESSALNARTYSDSAASSASAALTSKNAAAASEQAAAQNQADAADEKLKAEAWARGTKNNTGVPETDETYQNNSKWYSEQAKSSTSAAQAAQAAAEKARDEAQEIAGGDYATKTQLNSHIEDSTAHITAYERIKWNKAVTDVSNLSEEIADYLPKNQGSANVGKILVVGTDGNLTLTEMPEGGASGDVTGVLDEANNILLSGNLADGTYTVRYVNEDGTYSDPVTMEVGAIVTYTITQNLTAVTSDNSVTSVRKGESIAVNFTANDGYELSSVTVTMGGTDITSSAVSDNVVTIASVTGDVVITATAEEIKAIEPVTENITLTSDIRIGSDGTDRTQLGYCATPHIDLTNIPKPCTIHLTKALWCKDDGSASMVRVYAKKADGTKLVADTTRTDVGGGYFTVVDNSGGTGTDVTVTVTSNDVGYIRFSGAWSRYSDSDTSFELSNTKATLTYTPLA